MSTFQNLPLRKFLIFARTSAWILSVFFCGAVGRAAAGPAAPDKPLLHPLFSDEAVLQRGKPVAVWGWATPGAEVAVVLAGPGLTATPTKVKAGADGRWQAALGPFPAGGPYTLTASAGDQQAVAKDVLIGDVWLCGGQSNMGIPVFMAKNFKEEMAKGNYPRLRHLLVAGHFAGTPQELIKGKWQVCTPNSVAGWTAIPYFFGRQLHQDLDVPIGLVVSAMGGTDAEAWASAEAMATLPDFTKPVAEFQKLAKDVAEQKTRTGKDYPELIAGWYQAHDPGTAAVPPWSAPECDTADWSTVKVPGVLQESGALPRNYIGTLWLRREVLLPATAAGWHAQLNLDSILDWDTTWVNGQQVGAKEGPTLARIYDIPAHLLKAGTNSIAVRVLARMRVAGLAGHAEKMRLTFDDHTSIALAGEWRLHTGVKLKSAPPLPLRDDRGVGLTSLYNGQIAPLLPLALTGVIWYQGENNAYNRSYAYRRLLPTLIGDWRAHFGQGDLPFLIVSLANYMARLDQPSESAWAELREAQALTAQALPACGLTVTIDVGEAGNIHPMDKQTVGHRLALTAESIAYGRQVEWSGPWFKTMTVEGASIRLTFGHLGSGLMASDGAALTGFAIAGEDRAFVWAEARIDGDTVVVSSPNVVKPVAVRYAWADNPACNLANKAGLPAVPFRTDDWPGVTWPKPASTTR
jgi:sialate O-acetylesterase